jgi:FlaA1/EpsC-like NDP-sugar epimerase
MSVSFRRKILKRLAMIADTAVVCFTLLAALAISSGSIAWPSLAYILVIRIKLVNVFLLAGYLACSLAVFSLCGFYESPRLSGRTRIVGKLLLAASFLTGLLLLLRWPLQLAFATANFLGVFWLLTVGGLWLSREAGHWLQKLLPSNGRNQRNIVLVGAGGDVFALAQWIQREAGLGYRVLRIIDAQEMEEHERLTSNI